MAYKEFDRILKDRLTSIQPQEKQRIEELERNVAQTSHNENFENRHDQ
jgi:hypothetical protein